MYVVLQPTIAKVNATKNLNISKELLLTNMIIYNKNTIIVIKNNNFKMK